MRGNCTIPRCLGREIFKLGYVAFQADSFGPRSLFSSMCAVRSRSTQIGHEVILKTYPGAHHGFDFEGLNIVAARHDGGHRMRNNPAAADTIIEVGTFFAKHLK